jgi:hypothetical protein
MAHIFLFPIAEAYEHEYPWKYKLFKVSALVNNPESYAVATRMLNVTNIPRLFYKGKIKRGTLGPGTLKSC